MDSEPATDYLLPPMPQSPAPQQSARVAIICVGDSLSTGFSLQSSLGSILAARFRRHYGWFDSPDMSCLSIASRITPANRFDIHNMASVSAHAVTPQQTQLSHILL